MIPAASPEIGEEERAAVDAVLASGGLAQGPEVAAFEEEFSKLAVDESLCVAVNSGTSAQHLAMLAAGIGVGDEVIVPSFTFAATANSVALTGATPVFVDIEPDFFCLNPAAVEAAITPRTKAVMPVHLYGHPADLESLDGIFRKHNLVVIEDAAQAHLASVGGKKVGTWGIAGSFSFYPTKNMTSGEGGMVTTNDANLARTVRLLRNQGQEQRYKNEIVGFNNRMTDIHAAIGRVQLRKLQRWTEKRQQNASFYDRNFVGVKVPPVKENAVHVYHQYTIRIEDLDRDRFAEELKKHGVGSGVYYPIPNHRLAAYNLNLDLPETELAAQQVLSLPIYPSLTQDNLEKVVNAVNKVASIGVGSG
jgi:dTDP-4-amino-4,6-dideoxygalactose transaminase